MHGVFNCVGLEILRRRAANGRAPQEGRMPANGAAPISTDRVDVRVCKLRAKVAFSRLRALQRFSD